MDNGQWTIDNGRMITETIIAELEGLCRRISKLLGLQQGSVEIHYHKGEPKEVHRHDKSIKFKESKAS